MRLPKLFPLKGYPPPPPVRGYQPQRGGANPDVIPPPPGHNPPPTHEKPAPPPNPPRMRFTDQAMEAAMAASPSIRGEKILTGTITFTQEEQKNMDDQLFGPGGHYESPFKRQEPMGGKVSDETAKRINEQVKVEIINVEDGCCETVLPEHSLCFPNRPVIPGYLRKQLERDVEQVLLDGLKAKGPVTSALEREGSFKKSVTTEEILAEWDRQIAELKFGKNSALLKYLKFIPDAQAAAGRSKDPSTKVGAIALDDDYNVLSTGYNGFPRGVDDSPARYNNRETKYKFISHAESNVVAQAARVGVSLNGATLLLTSLNPCSSCAKLLIQAGIKQILVPKIVDNKRWDEEWEISLVMLQEAGVKVHSYYYDPLGNPRIEGII